MMNTNLTTNPDASSNRCWSEEIRTTTWSKGPGGWPYLCVLKQALVGHVPHAHQHHVLHLQQPLLHHALEVHQGAARR